MLPERRTLTAALASRSRYCPNTGGRAFYCECDFDARPAPGLDRVEVDLIASEEDAVLFFPALRRGLHQQVEDACDRGVQLVDIRIAITRIRTHPIDTCERAAEGCGRFVADVVLEAATALK